MLQLSAKHSTQSFSDFSKKSTNDLAHSIYQKYQQLAAVSLYCLYITVISQSLSLTVLGFQACLLTVQLVNQPFPRLHQISILTPDIRLCRKVKYSLMSFCTMTVWSVVLLNKPSQSAASGHCAMLLHCCKSCGKCKVPLLFRVSLIVKLAKVMLSCTRKEKWVKQCCTRV